MAQDIVGSKMQDFTSPNAGESVPLSNRGYGQNGSNLPSSLTPGQARKVSKTFESLSRPDAALSDIAARGVHCDQSALKWQQRPQSAKPGKPSVGMHDPNANNGKVPSSLSYGGAVKPSTTKAKMGIFRR
jgi:hypothetical protein